jgi:hypothetical protein
MSWGAKLYVPSLIKNGPSVQKLMGLEIHSQLRDAISLLSFHNKEDKLNLVMFVKMTSQYQSRFEVFMAMNIKKAVFCDVTPCGSCKNRCFGIAYRLHQQGERYQQLVFAYVVSWSLILFILMMGAILSSGMSVLTRIAWCHIPEDGIFCTLHVRTHKCILILFYFLIWKEN